MDLSMFRELAVSEVAWPSRSQMFGIARSFMACPSGCSERCQGNEIHNPCRSRRTTYRKGWPCRLCTATPGEGLFFLILSVGFVISPEKADLLCLPHLELRQNVRLVLFKSAPAFEMSQKPLLRQTDLWNVDHVGRLVSVGARLGEILVGDFEAACRAGLLVEFMLVVRLFFFVGADCTVAGEGGG